MISEKFKKLPEMFNSNFQHYIQEQFFFPRDCTRIQVMMKYSGDINQHSIIQIIRFRRKSEQIYEINKN